MTVNKRAGRAGRPAAAEPKGARGGRGRAVTLNVSQEVRDSLESESARTGRSMSQVAEAWLQIGSCVQGLPAIETAFKALADIARAVDQGEGDKFTAHFATISAMQEALPAAMGPAPVSPLALAGMYENEAIVAALVAVAVAIDAAPKSDPVRERVSKPPSCGGQESIRDLLGLAERGFPPREVHVLIQGLLDLEDAGALAAQRIHDALELLEKLREREAAEAAEFHRLREAAERRAAVFGKIAADRLTRRPGGAADSADELAPGAAFRAAFP